MSFGAYVRKGRTADFTVNLYEDDGSTSISLAADDHVRVKIFRRDGATPDLDLDSVAATANGSSVTIDARGTDPVASVTVRLAQDDTSGLNLGPYSYEVSVVDNSESSPADAIKHAETGVLNVLPAGGGDVGVS